MGDNILLFHVRAFLRKRGTLLSDTHFFFFFAFSLCYELYRRGECHFPYFPLRTPWDPWAVFGSC